MSALAAPRAVAAPTTMSLPQAGVHLIDFDEMLKRRVVRILVPYSRTYFFFNRGAALGATAEIGEEFEKWLNDKYKMKGAYRIHVVFIPTRRDKLFENLAAGRGDIAAGSLTVTSERKALVDFAKPWTADAREVLVTGPSAPQIQSLKDLGGKEILVRTSSSYHPHLMALSDSIKAEATPINLKGADEKSRGRRSARYGQRRDAALGGGRSAQGKALGRHPQGPDGSRGPRRASGWRTGLGDPQE